MLSILDKLCLHVIVNQVIRYGPISQTNGSHQRLLAEWALLSSSLSLSLSMWLKPTQQAYGTNQGVMVWRIRVDFSFTYIWAQGIYLQMDLGAFTRSMSPWIANCAQAKNAGKLAAFVPTNPTAQSYSSPKSYLLKINLHLPLKYL